jgi:ABC-type antimicrobial peptide transport system permease subunit
MGGRILYGREFTEGEVRSGAHVAVVNERFAAEFGAPRNVLGHQLTSGDDPPLKIIGVVRGMEYETDPTLVNSNQVFVPSSAPGSFSSSFAVLVEGRAEDHLASIRDTIQSLDPQVPVFGVATMEQKLDEVFAAPKFYRTSIAAFATFALLLAILGIYGTVAYSVVERTKEMGIRLALGSTPTQLRGMLLWNGVLMVAAGAIPGIASAPFTGRLLEHVMEGARPLGLAASGSVILLFVCVASASIWTATRRIATFDIVAIFRAE